MFPRMKKASSLRSWNPRDNSAETITAAFSFALLAFASGMPTAAKLAAILFAGHAFWHLSREDAARTRLLCGLAFPLLQLLSDTVLLASWLAVASIVVAHREESWLERTASLMTLVFPSLLLTGCQAYLSWLGRL